MCGLFINRSIDRLFVFFVLLFLLHNHQQQTNSQMKKNVNFSKLSMCFFYILDEIFTLQFEQEKIPNENSVLIDWF